MLSNFTDQGLALTANGVNMTYLYGLSDFFDVMFSDTERLNLFLQTTAQGAADVYSRFLQLTSEISLEDIQNTLNSSIKVVPILSSDAVAGEVNVYRLPETIMSSRFIANKPFLPTTVLEQNVDYRIEVAADGTANIRFARDISSAGFSVRLASDGVTKEYALWFVDVEIDERLISKVYGNLIGVAPENSTDAFHNFVYGLFYIYVHGPTLDLLRKGLNLSIGIPLARTTETVIDIRTYLETDEYIVVTDQNQYLIPYGLPPIVSVGDTLNTGDEVAQWVEIKDYLHDGDWWVNLQIPPSIIPDIPPGQVDRYATAGSHYDYLMRTYLKKHTFLVNVKVQDFKNVQSFEQLSSIIKRAKPAWTQPIYIWTVSTLDETLTVSDDEGFIQRIDPDRCENINYPIDKFIRDSDKPLTRGCPQFMRWNISYDTTKQIGMDQYTNGDPFTLNTGLVNGFVDSINQIRSNTDSELGWLRALIAQSSEMVRIPRTFIKFTQGIDWPNITQGVPVFKMNVPVGMRAIPLYLTTQKDIVNKCTTVGAAVPDMGQWEFDILNQLESSASVNSSAVNVAAVNDLTVTGNLALLQANYNTLFFRDSGVGYLSAVIPNTGWQSWAPQVSDLMDTDYLHCVRILADVVGVFWVTSNQLVRPVPLFPVEQMDQLSMTYSMPITRGAGHEGSPYYTVRGRGEVTYNSSGAVNDFAVNEENWDTGSVDNSYTDKYNTTPMPVDRSGVILTHAQELR